MTGAPSADVDELSGHVIVCGLQELALSVVEQLHVSGVDVVVIDDRPDRRLLPTLAEWSVPFVEASPRSAGTLVAAGALRAQAVICAQDDDLHTLETALVAHGLDPDLRVVVQLANAAVGRALADVTGPGSALDVADLAAPSLVQACLGQSHRHFDVDGQPFAAIDVTVDRNGTLRSLYGDLVPIAVVPTGTNTVDICPGRDRPVEPGDRVTVLGPPADLDGLPGWPPTPYVAPTARNLVFALRSLPRSVWRQLDWGFRAVAATVLLVTVVASLIIHLGYDAGHGHHLGLVNSVYFAVETIATVGYGDFNFATQSVAMRVFAIAFIIAGCSILTTMFAFLTNILVTRSVAQALGNQRVVQMREHVVVVGLGSIGVRVVELLLGQGRHVVVIERDEENRHLAQARALKVPIIIGNATLGATLEAANVATSSAVAVLTSDDLTNLETSLSLRDFLADAGRHDVPIILRVFDRNLAHTVEHNFGMRHVRSTSALAAPWFVGAALGLDILLTFYVEQERLLVARLTVAEAGVLAGLAMQDLSARIRVIAISRAVGGGLEHPPRRNTRFAPGDQAYLIGPYEELITVLRRDAVSAPSPAETAEPPGDERRATSET